MSTASLYDNVVAVTRSDLGAAADRFVARQIRNHLQKDPAKLEPRDLRRLLSWIELAMRTVHSNQQVVDDYMEDLKTLVQPKHKKPSGHGKKSNYPV